MGLSVDFLNIFPFAVLLLFDLGLGFCFVLCYFLGEGEFYRWCSGLLLALHPGITKGTSREQATACYTPTKTLTLPVLLLLPVWFLKWRLGGVEGTRDGGLVFSFTVHLENSFPEMSRKNPTYNFQLRCLHLSAFPHSCKVKEHFSWELDL